MEIQFDGATVQYVTSVGGPVKTLDVKSISMAEQRLREVAFVNPQRAPELLAAFNVAWLEASRILTQLEYEHIQAKIKLSEIKGIILLDKAAARLEARGLISSRNPAGSEGLRQAVVDTDPEYQAQQDVCNQLACIRDLIEGKMQALDNGYTSVKKILGDMGSVGYNRAPNHHLEPQSERPQDAADEFFGKAR